MKITKVEAIPVSVPIKPFQDSYATFTKCPAVITRIETDEDIVGYGEASAIVPEIFGETLESICVMIRNTIAPLLVGKDVFRIEYIYSLMDRALGGVSAAKTGIELALFDAIGKKLNQPVFNLLGGKVFDKVLVSFEIGMKSGEEMSKEALYWVERGLKVVKLKAGSGNLREDLARIRAVRDTIGQDILIRVDPNCAWTVPDCMNAASDLKQINIEYLEQPIARWNIDGLASIRQRTGLTIEADEAAWTIYDVAKIGKKGAADVINLKVPKVGGLLRGKKVATVAESFGMTCMGGSEGEVAGAIAAKIHLAASTPNALRASDLTELRWLDDWLLEEPIEMDGSGRVEVPSGPGLGVSINEEKLKKWTV